MTERITPTGEAIQIAAAIAAADAGEPLRSPSGKLRKLPKSATMADRLASGSVPMPNGCREWSGTKSVFGYGKVGGPKGSAKAHRLSYEIAFGEIPAGHFICHRCDNPSCINPGHLFVGTNDENMADMVQKGRQPRGERHGSAKLSADDVHQIRSIMGVKQSVIAAQFGVSQMQVSYIKTGQTWAHLPWSDADKSPNLLTAQAARLLAARENNQ